MQSLGIFGALFAFFTVLHLALRWRSDRTLDADMKLSRGLAAFVLAVAGFLSILRWWPLWPQGFIVNGQDRAALLVVLLVLGHLVADLVWMAGGRYYAASRPRPDLIAHHLVGLVAGGLALYFQAGYELVGIVISSEIMPTVSGIIAWAQVRGKQGLIRRALRWRLWALTAWRLPLWIALIGCCALALVRGQATPGLEIVYWLAIFIFFGVIGLDLFWTRQVLSGLERLADSEAGKEPNQE